MKGILFGRVRYLSFSLLVFVGVGCGDNIPDVDTPSSTTKATFIPSIGTWDLEHSPDLDPCPVDFSEDARTMIVRFVNLAGEQWREAPQIFKRSDGTYPPSEIEVPAWGEWVVFIKYKCDCDECCGHPDLGPEYIERYQVESPRQRYEQGGSGTLQFDLCDVC